MEAIMNIGPLLPWVRKGQQSSTLDYLKGKCDCSFFQPTETSAIASYVVLCALQDYIH